MLVSRSFQMHSNSFDIVYKFSGIFWITQRDMVVYDVFVLSGYVTYLLFSSSTFIELRDHVLYVGNCDSCRFLYPQRWFKLLLFTAKISIIDSIQPL